MEQGSQCKIHVSVDELLQEGFHVAANDRSKDAVALSGRFPEAIFLDHNGDYGWKEHGQNFPILADNEDGVGNARSLHRDWD